uniref:F-box associated beta-propeller type 3 domain-containing protein n=1 Tax=Arundo donax TaxID=35708 RepID=A0A0A8Y091_ARUDO
MRPPPVNGRRDAMQLFEMEGKLALSCCQHNSTIELWLMQDHANEVWVCAHRVTLPVELAETGVSAYIVSQEGDVLVNRMKSVLHFDRKGNLLREFRAERGIEFSRHVQTKP